jgi:hypothetical protein
MRNRLGNWIGPRVLVIGLVRWVTGCGAGCARQVVSGIQGFPSAARAGASSQVMPWPQVVRLAVADPQPGPATAPAARPTP